MKRLVTGIMLFLLAACAQTMAPHDAMNRVNQEFAGQDVGNFFISYGSPAGVVSSDSNGKVYRWLSLEPHQGESNYLANSGNYFIPDMSSEGIMTEGYCEIRINVDSKERIEKITLVNDSIGKFSGSRCAEIFGQAAPD